MKRRCLLSIVPVLVGLFAARAAAQTPLGTGFTYQGRLTDNGQPANAPYDLQFTLFDAATGGNPLGSPVTLPSVPVANGLFTVSLDFGALFAGDGRWLEIGVRPGGSGGPFTILTPRQALTPSPNAIFSSSAADSQQLGGQPASSYQLLITGACPAGQAIRVVNPDGTVVCETAGGDITSVDTPPGGGLQGGATSGAASLSLLGSCGAGEILKWTGSAWACSTDADSGGDITAVTAGAGLAGGGTSGAVSLAVDPSAVQSRVTGTCAAGSSIRTVNQDGTVVCEADDDTPGWNLTGNAGTNPATNFMGTTDNQALELRVNGLRGLRLEPTSSVPNVIGGFSGNIVTPGVIAASIGGGGSSGSPNVVTDDHGTVGGGGGNRAGDAAGTTLDNPFATVAGGQGNAAARQFGTVGGGFGNEADGVASTVGGGSQNIASGLRSTVSGGDNQTASGPYSTLGGGVDNSASGVAATVPGGAENLAGGDWSLAAGQGARVRDAATSGDVNGDEGTFVWADASTGVFFQSTGPNQFLVRAAGGVGINTNTPATALDVNGTVKVTGFRLTTAPAPGRVLTSDPLGNGTWQAAGSGDITAVNTGAGSGLQGGVASGDADLSLLTSCGANQILKWNGSAWACASDANSGGTLTGVSAGTGLNGGGTSGTVTLNVNLAGSGSATSVSRSDHDHLLQSWSGSAPGFMALSVVNTGSGGFSDGIWGQANAAGGGRGLVGYATATSGTNYGVWGQSDSPTGYAGYFPGRVAVDELDRSAPGALAIGPSTATSVTITPNTSVQGTLTVGGGTPIGRVLSTTAVAPFGTVPPGINVDFTFLLTGAAPGDTVIVQYSGSPPSPCTLNAWVSIANVVILRINNPGSVSCSPGSFGFRSTVIHF